VKEHTVRGHGTEETTARIGCQGAVGGDAQQARGTRPSLFGLRPTGLPEPHRSIPAWSIP
jgi:hypothetical protein